MPAIDRISIPQAPPAPAGDQLPDPAQLALIQWVFGIEEDGYGPASQEAVASLQRANSIPVDFAVMIGPRTWRLLLERYTQKVKSLPQAIPELPPGPTSDQLPSPEQLAVLQWVFHTDEDGYGPLTQAAVAQLQREKGIPVDPQVMIGPRTWAQVAELYRQKAREDEPWEVPAQPLRLDGSSPKEVWLNQQIDRLNTRSIPAAACYYVRNRQILALEQAGTPATRPLPVPATDDPAVIAVIDQLRWTQAKIDLLWARAGEIGIDPRVMLAVLFQEGTGSFNTNAAVPARFWNGSRYFRGGSGAQPDFEQDLAAALEHHVLAKVRAYGYYAAQFREAVVANGLGDGNLFQYVNWVTPWVKPGGWSVRPGCYATHTEWWKGLQRYFDGLAGEGATQAYSEYMAAHPAPVDAPPPAVRFSLTHNGTGPTERETNWPWVEAFPG